MPGTLNKKNYKCDISLPRNLVPYFGDLYMHEIESYHIVEYRKQRLQEKAANRKNLVNPGTVNREVGLLRNMINLAAEWFDLELKPIKYEMAKEEPKERIFTEQEIRRLIENSETLLRHIILVALNTGMRKAEILNLEWDQVNLEEGLIQIEAQRSKNRKIRVIPLNKSLSELFCKLHYSRNGSRYIFINTL